ncbi:MAG: hypothetical protein ABII68_06875 [Pseudomonadota bacterium]
MTLEPDQNRTTTLCLTVEKGRVPFFFPLLARGFTVKTRVGCSVKELICRHLGLSADYLEQRLQTIFLDGKAVDDTETAVVRQGATLALSTAMPGLAGATLRRGSAYAAMRNQITHQKNANDERSKDGTICLKLFNLVAEDIGQLFLSQGIWISGKYFQDLFRGAPGPIFSGCRSVEMDGVRIEAEALVSTDWEQTRIFLKINAV